MIHVVNKRTFNSNRKVHVYIGRPSPLGNPYTIGKDGTREEVIAKYNVWLCRELSVYGPVTEEMERIRKLSKEGDVHLVCWCAPLPCHGDVIKERLEGG